MKLILLVLISFSYSNINARLIEKNTDRTLTTETRPTGSSPPVRLTRDAFDEDSGTGSSREEGSDEQSQPYNRKTRNFPKTKSRREEPSTIVRVVRESHEKVDKPKKNNTATHHTPTKPKTLVKKPIPKYNNEMDYDEDFQMKVNRSPVKAVDSGEHEDEDFNLEDYDFDVNHDEFIGRGKPLEPRLRNKVHQGRSNQQASKQEQKFAPRPEVKVQSKAHPPSASHRPISNKRAAQYHKKAGEKEDYYDDTTTTQKAPEKEKSRDSEDDDENEESKEFEGKGNQSVRTIRSPWKLNADKLGIKSSAVMSKVLTILPMFPEVPKNNDDQLSGSMDSWYTRN